MDNIIEKIRKENLLGRSGSMFPVCLKWESVKNSDQKERYVICNASEGEVETFKDYYILKNHKEDVIEGINLAIKEMEAKRGYIYLNASYFDEFGKELQEFCGEKIKVIKKRGGYIGGEETSVIEAIEGNVPEPRIKPPFPSQVGLWGLPTLVNNVETLYCVAKINKGEYEGERFFSIFGDAPNKGVFVFPKDISVRELLEKTNNIPSFDYFVQVGGGGGGDIMLPSEIDCTINSLGSVIIYNKEIDKYQLMKKWANFFLEGNCDKCTPCREGLYRIMEMIEEEDFD